MQVFMAGQQERFYGYPLLREVELKCFEFKDNITAFLIAKSLAEQNPDDVENNNVFRERVFQKLKKLEQLKIISHREEQTRFKTRQYIFQLNHA